MPTKQEKIVLSIKRMTTPTAATGVTPAVVEISWANFNVDLTVKGLDQGDLVKYDVTTCLFRLV